MVRMVRGADGDGGCGFGGEVMMMYRRWIDGGSMWIDGVEWRWHGRRVHRILAGEPVAAAEFKRGWAYDSIRWILVEDVLNTLADYVKDGGHGNHVRVLDCFFRASGLRINMCKSKIMSINVEDGYVLKMRLLNWASMSLRPPSLNLGTKSWGNMSRKQAMERRCRFFNGRDLKSNKASWVKWNKVLTPKDKGGLRVSSLFALNRGLMLKWVWRFYSQKCSLWTKVIKAIYGEDGNLNKDVSVIKHPIELGNGSTNAVLGHNCLARFVTFGSIESDGVLFGGVQSKGIDREISFRMLVCRLVSWQGQYGRGDKKYPTIMLEAVASQDLWIWHTFMDAGSE
ncbi:RNA-directed DNA polymerase, eukaryota, reverse transcriptase zinc-binding domain protein [Tanacetum coccineum]